MPFWLRPSRRCVRWRFLNRVLRRDHRRRSPSLIRRTASHELPQQVTRRTQVTAGAQATGATQVPRRLRGYLVTPQGHALEEAFIVDLATELSQFVPPGASPAKVLELLGERDVHAQRRQPCDRGTPLRDGRGGFRQAPRRPATGCATPIRDPEWPRGGRTRRGSPMRICRPIAVCPDNHPPSRRRAPASRGSTLARRRICLDTPASSSTRRRMRSRQTTRAPRTHCAMSLSGVQSTICSIPGASRQRAAAAAMASSASNSTIGQTTMPSA